MAKEKRFGRLATSVSIVDAAAAISFLGANTIESDSKVITATGEASTMVVPDKAIVTFSV